MARPTCDESQDLAMAPSIARSWSIAGAREFRGFGMARTSPRKGVCPAPCDEAWVKRTVSKLGLEQTVRPEGRPPMLRNSLRPRFRSSSPFPFPHGISDKDGGCSGSFRLPTFRPPFVRSLRAFHQTPYRARGAGVESSELLE
jgi:hypothetical protein